MKRYKNIAALVIAVCMIFALSSCSKSEFARVRSFEYNFLKEEYEEEYSKVEKTIELEDDSNYEIKITSLKESGTIEMSLSYINEDGEAILLNITSPANETIEIPMGAAESFTFSAQIDSDTEGSVKVEILSDRK